MSLTRRSVLKGLAAAPVAVHTAANQAAAQLAGVSISGLSAVGAGEPMPEDRARQVVFRKFEDWLRNHGEKSIRDQADIVEALDADLSILRLPITTLIRMQRRRNYARLLDDQRDWFDKLLARDGKVTQWL